MGDRVLVLLPTATSKLLAQWQGPYPEVARHGGVNYEVNMADRRKHRRIFHVNMLQKWHEPSVSNLWVDDSVNTEPEGDEEDIPTWDGPVAAVDSPIINSDLTAKERQSAAGQVAR